MIIALLTDFGTKDFFVGAMRGVILSINETANIVDITHEIEPQNVRSASFTLRACYENFPAKTVFVAVVDPGVGSLRRAILVETADYFFVAPDNGLLSFVFEANENCRVFELTENKFFAENVSRTFHGRDIFAPVAAHLTNGVAPDEFGREIKDFVRLDQNAPCRISAETVEAEIVHIDRFGNLITNLRASDLPENFAVTIDSHHIEKLYDYFAEAERDEIFMIFGSAGFLEIVARDNSAAKMLEIAENHKIYAQNKI